MRAGSFVPLAVAMASAGGCATSSTSTVSTVPVPATYAPRFDYELEPELRAAEGSAGVVISLLNPELATRSRWLTLDARWSTLPERMAGDLQEMLIARGYVFQGPYRTADEAVWPERLRSDFFLLPTIDMEIRFSDWMVGRKGYCSKLLCFGAGDPDYHYTYHIDSTTVQLSGRIDLAAVETVTLRTLWRRSFDIDAAPIRSQGNPGRNFTEPGMPETLAAGGEEGIRELLKDEYWMRNAISQALEPIYRNVLRAVARQLDPQEMRRIKVMADELKKERK